MMRFKSSCEALAYLRRLESALDDRMGDDIKASEAATDAPALKLRQAELARIAEEFGPPPGIEAEATYAPPDWEVAPIVREVSRPARSRGLTGTRYTKIFVPDVDPHPLMLADPMRRSFAVTPNTGWVYIGDSTIGVGAQEYIQISWTPPIQLFTEEDWGSWVQQAWFYVSGGAGIIGVWEEYYLS